jgi:hypothetical protein
MLPPSNPTKARRGFQSRDCGLDKEHGAQGFAHARTRRGEPSHEVYAAGACSGSILYCTVEGGKKESLQSRYDAHMQRGTMPWFMIW